MTMAIKLPIYMDYHATTPVDPRVLEAMMPYFHEKFGNAASRNHPFGWEAEKAVNKARAQVARLIGARVESKGGEENASEIIFTSGATESNNLAIKGVAAMYRKKGNHIITQLTEHKAVIDPCKRLERDGFQVTYLPVDKFGQVISRPAGFDQPFAQKAEALIAQSIGAARDGAFVDPQEMRHVALAQAMAQPQTQK